MEYFDFNEFNSQIKLSMNLKTATNLHIGGSEIEDISDSPFIKYKLGSERIPFIPGTSIKGVLRSEAERIARSLNVKVCDLSKPCNRDTKGNKIEDYCDICSLFGGHGLAAHIRIEDAIPQKKISTVIKPGVAIHRTLGTSMDGALYNYEVVGPNNTFQLEMIIDNINFIKENGLIEDSEDIRIKIIIYLLRNLLMGNFYFGGKSSSGLGKMEIESINLELIIPDSSSPFLVNSTEFTLKLSVKNDLILDPKISEVN